MEYFYELHEHLDPALPMTCRYHEEPKAFKNHCHKNVEMLFITDGEGDFNIEGEIFSAKTGDTIIVNPYEFHSLTLSPGSKIKYICLITHHSFYEEYPFEYNSKIFKTVVSDETIMALGRKIYEESQMSELPYLKESVKAYVNILIISLLRGYKNDVPKNIAPDNHKYAIASAVVEYIRRNFRKGIDAEIMAEELGYCKFHLCRIFKEITGTTILQYTNSLKCFYAEQLLATGKYSIHEVSELCGFESNSYFSLLFKKFRGYLPSEVKK